MQEATLHQKNKNMKTRSSTSRSSCSCTPLRPSRKIKNVFGQRHLHHRTARVQDATPTKKTKTSKHASNTRRSSCSHTPRRPSKISSLKSQSWYRCPFLSIHTPYNTKHRTTTSHRLPLHTHILEENHFLVSFKFSSAHSRSISLTSCCNL